MTTGGGIEEDLIKCLAPTYLGDFSLRGSDLRKKGLNRIGNLLVPNDNYCKFEDWINPILDAMLEEQESEVRRPSHAPRTPPPPPDPSTALPRTPQGQVWSPSKIIHRLGKEINNEDSVYYWAWKVRPWAWGRPGEARPHPWAPLSAPADPPPPSPRLAERHPRVLPRHHRRLHRGHALLPLLQGQAPGGGHRAGCARRAAAPCFLPLAALASGGVDPRIAWRADIRGINDAAMNAKKTGMIILGGGLVKHHVCNANLMRNGADFSVFINTGQEFDGSDSGARPDEAISWGKIRLTAKPVKIYAEASLVFPFIVAQTFAKRVARDRDVAATTAGGV